MIALFMNVSYNTDPHAQSNGPGHAMLPLRPHLDSARQQPGSQGLPSVQEPVLEHSQAGHLREVEGSLIREPGSAFSGAGTGKRIPERCAFCRQGLGERGHRRAAS